MCLSIKVHNPSCVLAEGEHLGYEWIVVHNYMGYRCGYVRVPPGHPWHGENYNSVEASVHGGLTFAEPDEHCDKEGPDDAWWLGFDCAHAMDSRDFDLPVDDKIERCDKALGYMLNMGGVVRTQKYVEDQCKSLCEQAALANELSTCLENN